jgi:DNA gyrase subunit A
VASNHQDLLVFTSLGKVFSLKVYDVPQGAAANRGKPIINLIPVEKGEEICGVLPVREFSSEAYILMATRLGTVKKTELMQFAKVRTSGIIAIVLDDGDGLIDAKIVRDADNVVLATRDGMSIHFQSTDVRPMGRATRGVRGVMLGRGDTVVSLAVIEGGTGESLPEGVSEDGDAADLPEVIEAEAPADATGTDGSGAELVVAEGMQSPALLTICENGYGKATPPKDYRLQARGGRGVIAIKTSARNGKVVGLRTVEPDGEVIIVTDGGTLLRIPVREIRVIGRNTQGVRLINLSDGEKVMSFEHFVDRAGE